MPKPPYAQLQVQINGSAYQPSGIVQVSAGNVITLSAASTVGVRTWLWEIYDYPLGFTLPTGWTYESGTSGPMQYSGGPNPPTFTVPSAATTTWGKWMLRLRVNGNPLQYTAAGQVNAGFVSSLTDETTILSLLSPAGVEGMGFNESTQGDANRASVGTYMRALRQVDANATGTPGCYGGISAEIADVLTASLPSAGTPVKILLAHTLATALNTATSGNGVQAQIAGPLKISAAISFIVPSANPEVRFQIYQNGSAIALGAETTTQSTTGAFVSASIETLATAAAGDVFYLYAFTNGAGAAASLVIKTAQLVIAPATGRQGATGVQGPTGPAGTGGGGGIGPTGTPLTGATNAIATGNTSNSLDPTTANVGVQLQNGASDGENKNFVIVKSNAHDVVFTSPSDNIISLGNGGVPVGFSTPFKANGRGATITLTWVQAEISGAGAWVTA